VGPRKPDRKNKKAAGDPVAILFGWTGKSRTQRVGWGDVELSPRFVVAMESIGMFKGLCSTTQAAMSRATVFHDAYKDGYWFGKKTAEKGGGQRKMGREGKKSTTFCDGRESPDVDKKASCPGKGSGSKKYQKKSVE